DQAGLLRCDDLQGAAASASGQHRERPRQAAGPPQESQRAARQVRGDSQEEARRRVRRGLQGLSASSPADWIEAVGHDVRRLSFFPLRYKRHSRIAGSLKSSKNTVRRIGMKKLL